MYHVLNRANARQRIFEKDGDYLAFERAMREVQQRVPMRILAWCLMPNHWHLVLWPRRDGDLSEYMRLVTLIHTQRWHAHRATAGSGHLYQGRFKSFAVQDDGHFLAVCRYVEGNALRASLVRRAEEWRWCSLWRSPRETVDLPSVVDPWPVPRPQDWLAYVNDAVADHEIDSLRRCAQRGTPFGRENWTTDIADRLGLDSTLRPRGRPPRAPEKGS